MKYLSLQEVGLFGDGSLIFLLFCLWKDYL